MMGEALTVLAAALKMARDNGHVISIHATGDVTCVDGRIARDVGLALHAVLPPTAPAT